MNKEVQQQDNHKRYDSYCNYTSDKNAKPKMDCSTNKYKNGTKEADLIQSNT